MKSSPLSVLVCIFIATQMVSCGNESTKPDSSNFQFQESRYKALPIRRSTRPQTTQGIPHVQIGVELVPEVHDEMVRIVYSIPDVEDRPSVIASWRGLWLSEDITIQVPEAFIEGREFGHIHNDGSLHIFLEPKRANEAVDSGWAIHHPYAIQNRTGWNGFVMLYTPQSFQELEVTVQLIIDGYNYVAGKDYQLN